MNYRHTQFGTLIAVALGAGILFLILLAFRMEWHPIGTGMLLLLIAILALFHSLTVEVDDRELRFRFGIGLIRKVIALREIRKVEPVRNRWYYGWGIRLTPYGWLYNVSGLDAVEVTLDSGKRVRIGTDQPAELAEAIDRARQGR